MKDTHSMPERFANDERTVGALYKNKSVVDVYIEDRLRFSWQRLLHETQVSAINEVINQLKPEVILEIAPGPARLTVDLEGVKRGFLVEYSEEMLEIAKRRLKGAGVNSSWTLINGNAFELTEIKELPRLVDFIYTFRFIRHFHKEDRFRLYEAIHAKLPRGGLFMFDVVNGAVREKLDAKAAISSKGSLPVYDVTYTLNEFTEEMGENGFKVLTMNPVINHFPIQSWLSYKFDDLMPSLVRSIINLIEKIPSSTPLEWIAVCKKI